MRRNLGHLVHGAALLGLVCVAGCSEPTPPATRIALAPEAAAPAEPSQSTFATPEEAVTALVAAAERHDIPELERVLGPGTDDVLSSGDPIADRAARDAFVARYQTFHELVAGGPDNLVLQIDEDRWPLPVPLVRENERWRFDGAAGADELLLRRIGANELRTIDVMNGYAAAQDDYASEEHDGIPAGTYAQRLRSSPDKHDGLHWETAPGEPESPAGPLLAAASAEGYGDTQGARTPYHGYLYRLLTAQGPAAPGGARDYLVDGRLTGGFALLAYPEAYGVSGVTTFLVSQDGLVWQRDLGENTEDLAGAIRDYNPDDTWTPIAPEG